MLIIVDRLFLSIMIDMLKSVGGKNIYHVFFKKLKNFWKYGRISNFEHIIMFGKYREQAESTEYL